MRMNREVRSKNKIGLLGNLRKVLATIVAVAFAIGPVGSGALAPVAAAMPIPQNTAPSSTDGCNLNSSGGQIQHVIYIQFDNVHFRRDNPNVPSDLEQMPNLLSFLTNNGVVMTNHYTPLKSHTADDIVTSLTGVYGDRHGDPIANNFSWFLQPPSSETPTDFDGFGSAFTYWTDPVNAKTDNVFEMITAEGKNAPAPWVPWTRAGCNVGAASIANIELENVGSDLISAFGSDAPALTAAQAEVKANRNKAIADFEGISIHCAAGNAVCASANGGEPDVLTEEPGGYSGFNALYGHKFVAPVISPSGPLIDLNGNKVTDNSNPPNIGFPGFSGISAYQTLAYVAAMQEHGVPVTYAYISDAHDNHTTAVRPTNIYGPAECATDSEQGDGFGDAGLGPGDECYEKQLAAYNDAFGKFFARLAADGINKSNTLFVITADENDHFAGAGPIPSNCDGVHTYCSYSKLGEIDANLTTQLDTEDPALASTPFDIQFDMVPVFYIEGEPAVGAPIAREYERDAAALTAVSPITGSVDQLTVALADPVELKLLHMVTGDPNRTPSFVMFGNPDWFWSTSGGAPVEDPGFVWNHGGIQKEIITTWLGLVGPGVKNNGVDGTVWSDHTDIRPTMLLLTGLQDDYQSQGRVLSEELNPSALPNTINDSFAFKELARAYKEINAPVGPLGLATLQISTRALASGNASDDSKYVQLENQISQITSARDALATQMANVLDGAEFHGKSIDPFEADILTFQANLLTGYVNFLASQP